MGNGAGFAGVLGVYESYSDVNGYEFLKEVGYPDELARKISENVNTLTWKKATKADHFVLVIDVPAVGSHWETEFPLDENGFGESTMQLHGGKLNDGAIVTNRFQWNNETKDLHRICEKSTGLKYEVHYLFVDNGIVMKRCAPSVTSEVKFRKIG